MASTRTQATSKAGAGTAAGNVPQAAPASVPMPPRQRASDTPIPRPTLDDPWRDLHPARVWPD